MNCEEKRRLLASYEATTSRFSQAVIGLWAERLTLSDNACPSESELIQKSKSAEIR